MLLYTDRWKDFKAAFIKRFGRTTRAAWRDLLNRSQHEKEPVRDFGEAVTALASEAGKSCEDEVVISHFQHHVQENIQASLILLAPPWKTISFDHLLEIAENIEKTIQKSEGRSIFGSHSKASFGADSAKPHKMSQPSGSGSQGGRAPAQYSDPAPRDSGMTRAAVVSRPIFMPAVCSVASVSTATPAQDVLPGSNRPTPEPSLLDHVQVTMTGSDWLHTLSDHHQREILKQVAFYQPSRTVSGLKPAAPKSPASDKAPSVPRPAPAGSALKPGNVSKSPASQPAASQQAPRIPSSESRLISSEGAAVPSKDVPRVNYSQTTMMEMASTFDLLECPITHRGKNYTVVIDTGSALNLMSYAQAHRFGLMEDVQQSKLYFKMADGSVSESSAEVRNVPVTFKDITFPITFALLDECCHDLLLGTSFLKETLSNIQFGKGGAALSLTDGRRRVDVPVTCFRKKPGAGSTGVGGKGSTSALAHPFSPSVATVHAIPLPQQLEIVSDFEIAELVGLHLKADPPPGVSSHLWTCFILDFRPGVGFAGCPGNEPSLAWQEKYAGPLLQLILEHRPETVESVQKDQDLDDRHFLKILEELLLQSRFINISGKEYFNETLLGEDAYFWSDQFTSLEYLKLTYPALFGIVEQFLMDCEAGKREEFAGDLTEHPPEASIPRVSAVQSTLSLRSTEATSSTCAAIPGRLRADAQAVPEPGPSFTFASSSIPAALEADPDPGPLAALDIVGLMNLAEHSG